MTAKIAVAIRFVQHKPQFGSIAEICRDSWVPWTEGEPESDWTGLVNLVAPDEPNQHHPSSI